MIMGWSSLKHAMVLVYDGSLECIIGLPEAKYGICAENKDPIGDLKKVVQVTAIV